MTFSMQNSESACKMMEIKPIYPQIQTYLSQLTQPRLGETEAIYLHLSSSTHIATDLKGSFISSFAGDLN